MTAARCPVCAEPVSGEEWRCDHCDARQHPDCATYFGGCAIFACRDARAPAPLEIQSWPEPVRLVRQLATVSRWKARAAVAHVSIGVWVTVGVLLPWLSGGRLPGLGLGVGLLIGQVLMLLMPVVFFMDVPIRRRLRALAQGDGGDAVAIARVKASLPAQPVPTVLDAVTGPRVVIWLSVALFALTVALFAARNTVGAAIVVFAALFGPIAMAGLNRALKDIGDTESLLRALERAHAAALPQKPKAPAGPR